ncbi:MAG TPA: hypothetical protein VKV40_11265 [Ktedonobacteraceae bacterium]|nr:hypothetical protein [Ktedonobacteraceae bacterium]
MPKKTTRSGAQRNRAKVQKNVSLVRPNGAVTDETESQLEGEQVEETQGESDVAESSGSVSTATATATTTTPVGTTTAARSRTRAGRVARTVTPPSTEAQETEATPDEAEPKEVAPKGSASARLAARRQNQKSQQRIAPTLITPEHYAYVRKDLVYIAILAALMFATIIILHFIPGIGL